MPMEDMTSFRWILLLLGLLVLGLIFFLGSRKARSGKRQVPDASFFPDQPVSSSADPDLDKDLQDLGAHIRINENDIQVGRPVPVTADEPGTDSHAAAREPVTVPTGDIINLFLMAPEGEFFSGNQVLHAVTQIGMEYGDMRIFHYRESMSDKYPYFSIANILEPGWFDIEGLNEFQTPGIVIFMQVPNDHGTVRAYDCMVEKATQLSHVLRGHLLDASRSSLTPQTISHTREQLINVH